MMDTGNLRGRLWIALVLNASIVASEFVGGLLIHSVALMSDAMHNLVDQGALFLTLYATILAARKATARKSLGASAFPWAWSRNSSSNAVAQATCAPAIASPARSPNWFRAPGNNCGKCWPANPT